MDQNEVEDYEGTMRDLRDRMQYSGRIVYEKGKVIAFIHETESAEDFVTWKRTNKHIRYYAFTMGVLWGVLLSIAVSIFSILN